MRPVGHLLYSLAVYQQELNSISTKFHLTTPADNENKVLILESYKKQAMKSTLHTILQNLSAGTLYAFRSIHRYQDLPRGF